MKKKSKFLLSKLVSLTTLSRSGRNPPPTLAPSPPRSASSRAAPSLRTAPAGSEPHHGDSRYGARSMRRRALDCSRLCRRQAPLLFVVVVVVGRRVDLERCFRRREVDQLALRHGLW